MEGDNVTKVEINVHDGGQINFVKDNGSINAIQNNTNEDVVYQYKIKSRTQEYADKWNQNMFLNDFSDWDENAGINVKLKDVYIEEHLPHFIWGSNSSESTNLKKFLSPYIHEQHENKMLLILGQPGIGKSTLITWITANFIDKVDDILVYKFASDLENIDWGSSRVSYQILEKLGFEYKGLNGKTLILDGLDEISINDRRDVLENLYDNWIYGNHSFKFSLIITCRENYVQEIGRVKSTYIILQPWDEAQIRSFCNVFQKKAEIDVSESTIEKLVENRKILGIPLILYMTLALNISISKEGSIVDIYDKIFSLDGGIYDRCINNKKFAESHRIGDIKKQIHQISKDIAMWMFENNSEEAYISQLEYQKICSNVMKEQQKNENIEQDFLIGNFFKLVKHCEGIDSEELYFVHRSIYEYFVSETIYDSISKVVNESEKTLACVFGRLLKRNRLSKEMLTFLERKIKKSTLYKIFDKINASFQLMLQDGMTYNTNECYKNVIDCEMCVFANMLEIIHLWEIRNRLLQFDSSIINYINYNSIYNLNLSNLNLEGANLSEAKLDGVNLCGAKLCGARLNTLSKVKINGSIWSNKDIYYIRTMSKAKFMFIIIEEEQKNIFRSEIFPHEY